MKAIKKQALENPLTYSSDSDLLECSYSIKIDKFYLYFNAKFETFRTYKSLKKRMNYFINKYNLKLEPNK